MKNLEDKKIVCLGGGVGTSNLLRGLKKYGPVLTVVTSMADDGGSSGRLRKAYGIMPPGDVISCIAALAPDAELASLLTYRFSGSDKEHKVIGGHKFGNLLMLAEMQRTGDFYQALETVKKICRVTADIFPATEERVHLGAMTNDGRQVHSETTLDLALYGEPHGLDKVYLRPKNPKVNKKMIDSILGADVIISGPGDLYTNQLPVLIVPEIKEAVIKSKAKKIFILNVANKPFETRGFTLKDFVSVITKHLGVFPFDMVVANNNTTLPIPQRFRYRYIAIDKDLSATQKRFDLIEEDLVNADFPIYHDSEKLASVIVKEI